MKLAEGIRKHGFRKWYERELMQSHAHLALAFLSAIGLFAAFEAGHRFDGWADRIVDALAVLLCAVIGIWALRRYLYLLTHAEAMAHQADCPACQAYGRFKLLEPVASGPTLKVQCNKCEHQWTIDE